MEKDAVERSAEPRGFLARIGRLLASPWMAPVAVAIALLLTFRVVHNGLDGDDYFHRAVMNGSERYGDFLHGPQGDDVFSVGGSGSCRSRMDVGFLPWWTDPKVKAEFLQFLGVQTHILDYWLWPERPGTDARPQPAVVRPAGVSGGQVLSTDPGPHMDGRRRRAAVCR